MTLNAPSLPTTPFEKKKKREKILKWQQLLQAPAAQAGRGVSLPTSTLPLVGVTVVSAHHVGPLAPESSSSGS